MSNIQRHRLERNGAYLAEDHDGGWVLHSDHAAELARVEDDLLKMNNLAYEWRVRAERAEAYVAGQDVRSDFRNAGEMRAALDDLRDTMNVLAAETRASRPVIERLERHNTLLRAECEAWRAFRKAQTDGLCSDVGDAIVATFRYAELLEGVDAARAATDAAGILKGAGT